jgi:hypothetical protein
VTIPGTGLKECILSITLMFFILLIITFSS